jgi:hypothetical protein
VHINHIRRGCDIINANLCDGEKLEDPDRILDMMDLDQNDSIDVNEFFEVFRLVDTKDGHVVHGYGSHGTI